MTKEETMKNYKNFKSMVKSRKEPFNQFIKFLENESSWLKSPASTRFHLNEEGGLLKHSVGVANTLLQLREFMAPALSKESCVIVSLFHDVGKADTMTISDRIRFNEHDKKGAEITESVCQRLKMSNKETEHIVDLVAQHMKFINVQNMRESKLKRFLRQENFDNHLELHRIDCLSSHKKLDHYQFCIDKLKEYESDEKKLNPPKLIDGEKLKELGLIPGPLFAQILTEIENSQLEGKITTEEEAIIFVQSNYL